MKEQHLTKKHGEICILLSLLKQDSASFSCPNSMVSRWLGTEKPGEFYQPDLHGIVFTLSEIQVLVDERGTPEEDWEIRLPEHLAPYIEAQVWNWELFIRILGANKAQIVFGISLPNCKRET